MENLKKSIAIHLDIMVRKAAEEAGHHTGNVQRNINHIKEFWNIVDTKEMLLWLQDTEQRAEVALRRLRYVRKEVRESIQGLKEQSNINIDKKLK